MMKQGVIVYVMGGDEPPQGVIPGTLYQGLSQPSGPTEVVISRHGILDLDDAWHFLLNRGCDPIHLLVTQAEEDRLRPVYPLVRLSDISRVAGNPAAPSRQRRALH